MIRYEILEHRADLKIRAFGGQKEKVFLSMLLAMTESQRPEIKEKEKITREIKVKATDLSALLVGFLSEALYLSQVNREVYFEVTFKKFSDTELEGELTGQKVERFGEDIKAVTWHSLDVHQEKDGTWQATVLFDV